MRCNSNSSHLLLAENMLILCFACAAAASCVNGAARHRLNIQHLPPFFYKKIFPPEFTVFRLNKILDANCKAIYRLNIRHLPQFLTKIFPLSLQFLG